MKKAKYTVFVTGTIQDKYGYILPDRCDFLPCRFESNSRNARKHLMEYLPKLEEYAASVEDGAMVQFMTCTIFTDYATASEVPVSRADYSFIMDEHFPVITYGAYKPID